MATRLSLYNDALLLLGERDLSSLTEEREPRRLLDHVWNNGGINHCLSKGQWFFAMRTIQIDYDTSIDPQFGYRYGFSKPTDWVITSSLCTDEYFRVPLLQYVDESGYWYSDEQTLYVRYVSNDTSYGNDLGNWPDTFKEYAAAYFARKIAKKLGGDDLLKTAILEEKMALKEAKNNSAMQGPTQMPAQGNWSLSRQRYGGRNDGGNSGNLIG